MPLLEEIPPYSRTETVAVVRDFYQFLARMYLDPSEIREPPEGGWPIAGFPSGFDKSDEVLALLRELPYLGLETRGGAYMRFAAWDHFLNPLGPVHGDATDGWGLKTLSEGFQLYDYDAPPECVGLTIAGRYDVIVLLDTKHGIVYWICDFDDAAQNAATEPVLDEPEDFAPESECDWRRAHKAWAVGDFFEAMKDHFRKLNFVPIDSETVYDVWATGDECMVKRGQEIYREHGWPDLAHYRKDECMKAIQKLLVAENSQ